MTAPSVTIGGQTTTITEPLGSSALDLTAATGQKTWVIVDVTITPGADNLAGEPHTFTVQVTGSDGDGPFPDGARTRRDRHLERRLGGGRCNGHR